MQAQIGQGVFLGREKTSKILDLVRKERAESYDKEMALHAGNLIKFTQNRRDKSLVSDRTLRTWPIAWQGLVLGSLVGMKGRNYANRCRINGARVILSGLDLDFRRSAYFSVSPVILFRNEGMKVFEYYLRILLSYLLANLQVFAYLFHAMNLLLLFPHWEENSFSNSK